MGKEDTPPAIVTAAPPAEQVDVEYAGDLEKSLLKRRKGMTDAFLTKGQRKPSILTDGQLGNEPNKL